MTALHCIAQTTIAIDRTQQCISHSHTHLLSFAFNEIMFFDTAHTRGCSNANRDASVS